MDPILRQLIPSTHSYLTRRPILIPFSLNMLSGVFLTKYCKNEPLSLPCLLHMTKKLLYSYFWVIPQHLNFMCQSFGMLCLFHHHMWCKQEELTNTVKLIYLKLVLSYLIIRSTFHVEKNNGHFMRWPVRVTACISKCHLSCIYPSEECLEQIL